MQDQAIPEDSVEVLSSLPPWLLIAIIIFGIAFFVGGNLLYAYLNKRAGYELPKDAYTLFSFRYTKADVIKYLIIITICAVLTILTLL